MKKAKILTEKEIHAMLERRPGWIFDNNKIIKEFSFNNFAEGSRFVYELAPFCDRIDHHPDVQLGYRKIIFELQRYDVGGKVTDRDFVVADEIDRMYAASHK